MLITPIFRDYLDYFYNFNIGHDAAADVISSTCVFIASIIYAIYLTEYETSKLVLVAIIFYIINNFFNILLVMNYRFGLNKFGYVSI
jgi:hypothetical protein